MSRTTINLIALLIGFFLAVFAGLSSAGECAYLSSNTTIRIDGATCEMYLLTATEFADFQNLIATNQNSISLQQVFAVPESASLTEAFRLGFSLVLIAYLTSWAYGVIINWFNPDHDRY